MIFVKFWKNECPESGFPDRPVLSSECRIPKRSGGIISENLLKSGESEFYQAFFLYFARGIKLKKFFQIVSGLTEPGPYPVSSESAVKASAKPPQILGCGDESLCRGSGFQKKTAFFFANVGTSPHEDMSCLRGMIFNVLQAAEAAVRDRHSRDLPHPLREKVKSAGENFCVRGISDEIFSGYHKTVPVKCHLRFCAEFAGRMKFSFFNRAHIGVGEGNDPVLYMFFSGKFQSVLFIKQSQNIQRASRTFSSSRSEPAKCPA